MSGDQQIKSTQSEAVRKAVELAQARDAATSEIAAVRKNSELTLPETLDWRAWPLPVLVNVLSRIPMPGGRDGSWYYTPEQALILGVCAYKLDLDPFLGEVYMMQNSHRANITLAGKMARARKENWKLGAPRYERDPEDSSKPVIAYKCILPVGDSEITYTARLAEWMMPGNPNWKTRPEHMLQVRALEKAISFATGIGVSENPDDADISTPQPMAPIVSTPVRFIEPEGKKP